MGCWKLSIKGNVQGTAILLVGALLEIVSLTFWQALAYTSNTLLSFPKFYLQVVLYSRQKAGGKIILGKCFSFKNGIIARAWSENHTFLGKNFIFSPVVFHLLSCAGVHPHLDRLVENGQARPGVRLLGFKSHLFLVTWWLRQVTAFWWLSFLIYSKEIMSTL